MRIDLSQFDGMTPGPWTPYRHAALNITGRDGNRVVANCGGYSSSRDFERVDNENYANARAIAALPDLIDELRNTESERAYHAMTAGCLRTDLEYAQAEIARLREALEEIVTKLDALPFGHAARYSQLGINIARAALDASHDEKPEGK